MDAIIKVFALYIAGIYFLLLQHLHISQQLVRDLHSDIDQGAKDCCCQQKEQKLVEHISSRKIPPAGILFIKGQINQVEPSDYGDIHAHQGEEPLVDGCI